MTALALARSVRELLPDAEMHGDPLALYWLALGSPLKLAADRVHSELLGLLQDAAGESLVKWLRAHTHADVLALLDRVVQRMERE